MNMIKKIINWLNRDKYVIRMVNVMEAYNKGLLSETTYYQERRQFLRRIGIDIVEEDRRLSIEMREMRERCVKEKDDNDKKLDGNEVEISLIVRTKDNVYKEIKKINSQPSMLYNIVKSAVPGLTNAISMEIFSQKIKEEKKDVNTKVDKEVDEELKNIIDMADEQQEKEFKMMGIEVQTNKKLDVINKNYPDYDSDERWESIKQVCEWRDKEVQKLIDEDKPKVIYFGIDPARENTESISHTIGKKL